MKKYIAVIAIDRPKGGEWRRIWTSETFNSWTEAADTAIIVLGELPNQGYGYKAYVKTEFVNDDRFSRTMEQIA